LITKINLFLNNKDLLVSTRDWANGDLRLVLNPWWVTGIVDGEGSFNVSIQTTGNKPKITVTFKVDQKEDSAGILYDLSRFFKCGSVSLDSRGYKSYRVSSIDSILEFIIPHFDKYPLITSKQLNYLAFREIVELIKNKESSNTEGVNKIKGLLSTMNSKRSFLEKWNYLNLQNLGELNPNWLQAFIDGEGSFQFGIATRISRGKPYVATTPTLEIAQNTHDIRVLNYIKDFFEVGYLKPKFDISDLEQACSVRSVSRFVLRDSDKIIKFIDQYPMFTRKQEDYLNWKKLVHLKTTRAFDTEDGRALMEAIKSSMNTGKYR